MPSARRVVHMRNGPRRGGQPKTWGFGYPDLAALFGMSMGAVRRAVYDGRVDPLSLASIMAFANKRRRLG